MLGPALWVGYSITPRARDLESSRATAEFPAERAQVAEALACGLPARWPLATPYP